MVIIDDKSGQQNIIDLKIITTKVCRNPNIQANEKDDITYVKGALIVPCGESTALEVCDMPSK